MCLYLFRRTVKCCYQKTAYPKPTINLFAKKTHRKITLSLHKLKTVIEMFYGVCEIYKFKKKCCVQEPLNYIRRICGNAGIINLVERNYKEKKVLFQC